MAGTVRTAWEVWTYDVWGNEEDGFEVNDRSCADRKLELFIPSKVYNAGAELEFRSASPSDKQLSDIFGYSIETDGDDMTIYATNSKTGRPIGEMVCISHECLSPIGKCLGEFDEDGIFTTTRT